jgi:hypothetical protein
MFLQSPVTLPLFFFPPRLTIQVFQKSCLQVVTFHSLSPSFLLPTIPSSPHLIPRFGSDEWNSYFLTILYYASPVFFPPRLTIQVFQKSCLQVVTFHSLSPSFLLPTIPSSPHLIPLFGSDEWNLFAYFTFPPFLFPLFASRLSQANTYQSRSFVETERYSPSPSPPPPVGANWFVRHPTEFPNFLFPCFASHFSQANTYQCRNVQVTATQRYRLLFPPSPPPPTGTFVIPGS